MYVWTTHPEISVTCNHSHVLCTCQALLWVMCLCFFLRQVLDHLKCISNTFQASTSRLTDMIGTLDMSKPVIIPFIECLLQSSTIELAYRGPITIFFDQLVVHIITEDFAVIKPDASVSSSVSYTRLYPELNTILIFTTYDPVAGISVGGLAKHEYCGNLDMICELKWSSRCAAANKISAPAIVLIISATPFLQSVWLCRVQFQIWATSRNTHNTQNLYSWRLICLCFLLRSSCSRVASPDNESEAPRNTGCVCFFSCPYLFIYLFIYLLRCPLSFHCYFL